MRLTSDYERPWSISSLLAVKRCDEAFGSFAQLLQGPDVYGLGIVMAAHFIEVAAHNLQDGMEDHDVTRHPWRYHRFITRCRGIFRREIHDGYV